MKHEANNLFRVLVADDEQTIRQAYADTLTVPGDDATGAHLADLEEELFSKDSAEPYLSNLSLTMCRQGDEALATVRQACSEGQPYALAFLDVRMPPGDSGVEVAAKIRAIDPDINFVFVTGYSDLNPREIAEIVPPVEKLFYLSKPFHHVELQQFAAALTNKWAAERDLREAHLELMGNYAKLESAHHELMDAKYRAEAASRAKSVFLANMSHELRTPLNAIVGFSEIMKQGILGPLGNPKYLEYAEDIYDAGNHLTDIINDILDLSKVEAGKEELQEEVIEITGLLNSVRKLVSSRAHEASVRLEFDVARELPALRADQRKLKQIFVNLLSNAIKFTDAGGRVTFRAWYSGDGGMVFQVADTGIGIATEDVPIALAPFRQVEHGLARKYQGTGLGLTLAKTLVEMHGGSLDLQSQPGVGTTVTVRLPASRAVIAAA